MATPAWESDYVVLDDNTIESEYGKTYTHHEGFVATLDGYVRVWARQWSDGMCGTTFEFIHRGRLFKRVYDRTFQPRYLVTLAKRFAADVATQEAHAPNADGLLPCPHCGETNIDATSYTDASEYWMIYCPSCRILMDVANRTKDEAFALWNKRVAVPVPAMDKGE